jgi:putative addiction module component (TIGR02574 family)
MGLMDYKNLSTEEKILLVEEIWDSISDDKITLGKQQKDILNDRLATFKATTERTTWASIKSNVRARNKSK